MESEHNQISEINEEEFVYLLDGFTMNVSYLKKGCKSSKKLYLHHSCIEGIPQIATPTEINILEIFNTHLQSSTPLQEGEEKKILSPFKTRGILLLKLNSICRGNTPIQMETLELLKRLYEEDILPIIPVETKRSSCGNTYHIAAVGRVLLGEGEVLYKEEHKPTKEVFESLNITPIQLKDPEYKSFIEGNEYNTMIIVDAYDRVMNCLQSLALGVSLGLLSHGKIGTSMESSFFHQYTMKGMSRMTNLLKNFMPKEKQSEDKEIKGQHPMKTDSMVVDFVCSFGRIFELVLFMKEMIPMELNCTRDQTFVHQRKEDIGIGSPSWGNGGFSGVIAREVVGIAKELMILCKRYEELLPSPLNASITPIEHKEKNVMNGPFERSLDKVRDVMQQTCEMIAAYFKQVKQLKYQQFHIESTQQLIDQLNQIPDDELLDAIKYGNISKIMRTLHYDF